MTDHVTDSLNFPGDDPDALTMDLVEGHVYELIDDGDTGKVTVQEASWTPMRSDAAEIEFRFAQSTDRLRRLRARKHEIFDAIRDEVIANNRLARAARIYNIELEGDDGNDSDDT